MKTLTTEEQTNKILSRIFIKEDGTIILTEAWEELIDFLEEEE